MPKRLASASNGERPYDVVRIIARINVGGPARHVTLLSSRMEPRYRTLLVVGTAADEEIELSDIASIPNLHIHRIAQLGRSIKPWDDVIAFVRIFRLLKRIRPRIVHTHTAKAGLLGRLAAKLAGVGIRVHTYHGHVFHSYFGKLQSALIISIERLLARTTTRVVVISQSQRADVVVRYRVAPASKVSVIPLGLDLSAFESIDRGHARAQLGLELGLSNVRLIGSVGRLVAIKNHGLLLSAFKHVLRKRNDVHLVIVGGGEDEGAIRARIRELAIEAHVHMLGWRNDLGLIYGACDVIALSSDNEGTPVALIEALASGCRVVATDVGGVREILEEGRRGMVSKAGDVEGFAGALLSALDLSPPPSTAISRRYGIDRLIHDMVALYDQLEWEAGVLPVERAAP